MRGLTDTPSAKRTGPQRPVCFGGCAAGQHVADDDPKAVVECWPGAGSQRKLHPRALYPAPRENPHKVLRESKAVVSRAGTLRCSTDFLPNVSIV